MRSADEVTPTDTTHNHVLEAELKAEKWLADKMNINGFKLDLEGGFEIFKIWNEGLKWDDETGIARFGNMLMNFTYSWGECAQLLLKDEEIIYYKYEKPKEPSSTIIY